MLRYAVSFLLGALLLIIVGIFSGYLRLDLSAPPGRELTASGVLAFWDTCDDYGTCDDTYSGPWYVFPEDQDVPAPPQDQWYTEPQEPVVFEPAPFYGEGWNDWSAPYGFYDEGPVVYEDSWYARAFPGIGGFFQHVIPGQTSRSVVQPVYQAPAPQPRIIYPQPSCWISADPMRVTQGGSASLQWSSFNASRAVLSDFGEVPTTGFRTISGITSDRIYTLSVAGQGGNGSCYTRISVEALGPAPSCIISANPSVISRGQTSSLAWGSLNAGSAALSGVGGVNTQGGMYVAPVQSTTYTLTVYGSGNRSSSCSASVNVRP